MAEIHFDIEIPDELKEQAEKLNLEVSESAKELIKRELLKQILSKKLESKEEKEIIKWSIELGRKAKKDRFKQLLEEVSPEIREKLLSKLSPKEKREYLR